MPHARTTDCATYAPWLTAAADEFDITTLARLAAWIAQLAHESGNLRYVEEIASGKAYEGRKDLGNIHPGDGVTYKGHGLIQITGRNNHKEVGDALSVDFIRYPKKLMEPALAARSAGWFWKTRGLNELADIGEFVRITRRINGGTNGLAERQGYWAAAKKVFGVE
jgi:putative chitinase